LVFGTVNRMILAELVKVFLLALTALTGMFMLGGVIQEASQKGLGPAQILMAIPLIIPNTFPYTIPATTLFATCIVYGRLAADNEVLVLRAAGVNIYHLLWPAVFLGLITTAATAALYYDPIPRSQRVLRAQLEKDAENIIYSLLNREGGMRKPDLDFVLFVRDVQGKDLIDVVVKKRKADKTGYEMVARAQTARLRVRKTPDPAAPDNRDNDKTELVIRMDRCVVDALKGESSADFQDQEYGTPLPKAIFGRDTKERPASLTWKELDGRLADLREDIGKLEAKARQLAAETDSISLSGEKSKAEQIRDIDKLYIPALKRQISGILTEKQMRPALSLGCLCFVLIGCPVGIWASRSDYLSVFMLCFLPTIIVYYPILMAALNLAKEGKGSPFLAWVPNAVLVTASGFLIRRLMKR